MSIIRDFVGAINGLRKWSIMAGLITLGAAFRIVGLLTGAEMVDLLKAVGVAFMASNAIEHSIGAVKDWAKRKAGL